jgi:adenine phosphoribosyltransferase
LVAGTVGAVSDLAAPGPAATAVERARASLTSGFPMVDDHPDVAGVLRDPALLALLGPALAAPFHRSGVTKVLAPEARGPILGALVAVELGAGLVLGRKRDANHPGADTEIISAPTWRGVPQHFITRSFDLEPDDRVLVVDDWVTTGHSIAAMRETISLAGAEFVGAATLVDKAAAATITHHMVHCLVRFDALVMSQP